MAYQNSCLLLRSKRCLLIQLKYCLPSHCSKLYQFNLWPRLFWAISKPLLARSSPRVIFCPHLLSEVCFDVARPDMLCTLVQCSVDFSFGYSFLTSEFSLWYVALFFFFFVVLSVGVS